MSYGPIPGRREDTFWYNALVMIVGWGLVALVLLVLL